MSYLNNIIGPGIKPSPNNGCKISETNRPKQIICNFFSEKRNNLLLFIGFVLFNHIQNLPGDGLHTLFGGMPVDLVDIVESDAWYGVVIADGEARLVDVVAQFAVEQEIDFHVRIAFLHMVEHIGHGRTESVEIAFRPLAVFIRPHLLASPTVVGGTENEDDVGIAQIVHACDERPIGVVVAIVAPVTHRAATVGIVHTDAETTLVGHLPPPGLCDIVDIGAVAAFLIIPHLVGGRCDIALESGIGVAEDGD